jgi:AcrR family transcriptional regulator
MPTGIICTLRLMTASTSEGLRERKKRKTQQALQAAAIRLMSENGFANTTIEQIAEGAEVSPRTFFRYFPTKEAVLLTDLQDELVADYLAQAPADLPIIDTYEAALAAALNSLTSDEWAVEQSRMRLAAGTAQLGMTVGLANAALRPLSDATDFIARRLNVSSEDPRPRVYAATMIAAAAASVAPLLPDLAENHLERGTLIDAVKIGLELLRDGFPTGVASQRGRRGSTRT